MSSGLKKVTLQFSKSSSEHKERSLYQRPNWWKRKGQERFVKEGRGLYNLWSGGITKITEKNEDLENQKGPEPTEKTSERQMVQG